MISISDHMILFPIIDRVRLRGGSWLTGFLTSHQPVPRRATSDARPASSSL